MLIDKNYIIKTYRELHQVPEIGFDLPKTTAIVKRELEAMGVAYTEEFGKGSIVATINEGKPFTIHVANGDKVTKGQLLMEVDLEAVKAAGLNTITPMLICNTDEYPTFNTFVGKNVTNEDVVIELAK